MKRPLPPCCYVTLPWTTREDWQALGIVMGSEGRALLAALPVLVPFFLLEVLKEVLR